MQGKENAEDGGRYKLVVRIEDLRADIDAVAEEGTEANDAITRLMLRLCPNAEDLALVVDTRNGTVEVEP